MQGRQARVRVRGGQYRGGKPGLGWEEVNEGEASQG